MTWIGLRLAGAIFLGLIAFNLIAYWLWDELMIKLNKWGKGK